MSGLPSSAKLTRPWSNAIEAEAAAFLVAARAGLFAQSGAYLASHVPQADVKQVNMELIVRAAARTERLADIHHGSMAFSAKHGN